MWTWRQESFVDNSVGTTVSEGTVVVSVISGVDTMSPGSTSQAERSKDMLPYLIPSFVNLRKSLLENVWLDCSPSFFKLAILIYLTYSMGYIFRKKGVHLLVIFINRIRLYNHSPTSNRNHGILVSKYVRKFLKASTNS